MSKPGRKQNRTITLDFSEWELGDWPEDLWESVEFRKHKYSLDIEISSTLMREAARKIGQEAVEAWLTGASFWFSTKGLEVVDDFDNVELVVAWEDIWFRSKTDLDWVQAQLDKRRAELKEEEK